MSVEPLKVEVTPIDGWGFFERDFGTLADPFEADVVRVGPGPLVLTYGWQGTARVTHHRYAGRPVLLTPRNTPFAGVVVLRVFDREIAIGAEILFDGMADTAGLKRDLHE
ncbi:hypothetical protein ACLB0R_14905 [Sphingomonas sp. GlSt437]|uniref:hypothetical protein n=1 Tax=Sphingomonas sp. GlSt437 TaxID=3389970 RepID=UPI003A8926C9